jgi:hypothetical protein
MEVVTRESILKMRVDDDRDDDDCNVDDYDDSGCDDNNYDDRILQSKVYRKLYEIEHFYCVSYRAL